MYFNVIVSPGNLEVTSLQFQLTTDPNVTTPTFNLTCISTGGPVTTFSWRRDGALVTNNNSYNIAAPVVTDAVSGTYSLNLTVTGRRAGRYECSVTNSRTPMDTGNLTIESKIYVQFAHESRKNAFFNLAPGPLLIIVSCAYRLPNLLPFMHE